MAPPTSKPYPAIESGDDNPIPYDTNPSIISKQFFPK